jgi:hypothetical protein
MKHLVTAAEINASAERVWQVLTDFAAYPDWNPFIRAIEGRPELGARLRVHLHPSWRGPMTLRVTIERLIPNQALSWSGRIVAVPGLLSGEHGFGIEPLDPGRARFVHDERFSGPLVPLLAGKLDQGTRRDFEAMNAALKARAEAS